ncbi:MAG: hypothetical protein MUD01_26665 [Chloroflexaceae bacterium]|jgi:hypothetical protein|nr:hypothetical protein [Chloroflexaceae bacterium]
MSISPITYQGIHELRAGNQQRATDLLLSALAQNQRDLHAWLWLSGALPRPDEQRFCLEQVLRLNPAHPVARRGLVALADVTARPLVSLPLAPPRRARATPALSLTPLLEWLVNWFEEYGALLLLLLLGLPRPLWPHLRATMRPLLALPHWSFFAAIAIAALMVGVLVLLTFMAGQLAG